MPVVIGGVVGARAYHLFTGYDWSKGGLVGTVEIWRGGLSIWGAVLGGSSSSPCCTSPSSRPARVDGHDRPSRRCRASHRKVRELLQSGAVRATDDTAVGFGDRAPARRLHAVRDVPPTFLYESLWCLLVFAVIVIAERRFRRGQAFAMYVSLYTLGRTWFEALRIDKATRIFGIRFNLLLSAVICVGAAAWFIALGRRKDADHDVHRRCAPGCRRRLRSAPSANRAHEHVDGDLVAVVGRVPGGRTRSAFTISSAAEVGDDVVGPVEHGGVLRAAPARRSGS